MKKTAASMAFALMLVCSKAAHAGPFGTPESSVREEGVSLAVGYFRNATKWKPGGGDFSTVEIQQNQAYVEAASSGYCFTEEGEGFIRVGGADFDDGEQFKDGFKPFGAAGIRDVWYGEDRSSFKVGTILQGSYFLGYEAERTFIPGSPTKAKVKGKWEVSLGVAAQYRIGDKTLVYAGPQVTYSRAKVTREATGFSDSTTFNEDSLAGVFAGARIPLLDRVTLAIEGQYRGGFSGGASLAYTFR